MHDMQGIDLRGALERSQVSRPRRASEDAQRLRLPVSICSDPYCIEVESKPSPALPSRFNSTPKLSCPAPL